MEHENIFEVEIYICDAIFFQKKWMRTFRNASTFTDLSCFGSGNRIKFSHNLYSCMATKAMSKGQIDVTVPKLSIYCIRTLIHLSKPGITYKKAKKMYIRYTHRLILKWPVPIIHTPQCLFWKINMTFRKYLQLWDKE